MYFEITDEGDRDMVDYRLMAMVGYSFYETLREES